MSAKADHKIKGSSQPGETETISATQKLCFKEKWGNKIQKEIISSTFLKYFLGIFKDKGRSPLSFLLCHLLSWYYQKDSLPPLSEFLVMLLLKMLKIAQKDILFPQESHAR